MRLELDTVSVVRDARTPWAHEAIAGVDLVAEPGERLVVTGGNGAGKSTLAWVLAGATEPTSGRAELGGAPLTEQRHRIGLVVQHARLQLLRPTVASELAVFGLRGGGARQALECVGLTVGILPRRVDELSVGQQRRVCLAAALARPVRLLVLDEPLAGLDRGGIDTFLAALTRLDPSTTVVTVTHEPDTLDLLGERHLRLEAGRLVEERPGRPLGATP